MAHSYTVGEQTKNKILTESKKLFYKNGYTKTTYSDISSIANINRALIPYHFKNKKILGIEIYRQIISDFYNIIDNVLDTSQYDSDFVAAIYTIFYYRLLSVNPSFIRFISELQADENATLFSEEYEKEFLIQLGNKFKNLNADELEILVQMHIGIKSRMVNLLCNQESSLQVNEISRIHIQLLMRYVGYSAKKIDELINAAIEISSLLSFEIIAGFEIVLKYN